MRRYWRTIPDDRLQPGMASVKRGPDWKGASTASSSDAPSAGSRKLGLYEVGRSPNRRLTAARVAMADGLVVLILQGEITANTKQN